MIGAVIAVAAIVAISLAAIAAPTTPEVSGTAWFKGGVPASWNVVKVEGFSNDGEVLQAWEVPGPKFGRDRPFLAVVKIKQGPLAGGTAAQFLSAVGQLIRSEGAGQSEMVTLQDGAPAITWTRPDTLGATPSIAVTDYLLYAEDGKTMYELAFLSDTQHFGSEAPAVKKVMFNFKGTDR